MGSAAGDARSAATAGDARSAATAGDCRQDRHAVAVLDRGVEGAGEPDVLVVDVDVDEPVQLTVVGDQPALEAGVTGVQVVDERGERVAPRLDGLRAAGVGAQDGRNLDLDGHEVRAPVVREWNRPQAQRRDRRLSSHHPGAGPSTTSTGSSVTTPST